MCAIFFLKIEYEHGAVFTHFKAQVFARGCKPKQDLDQIAGSVFNVADK